MRTHPRGASSRVIGVLASALAIVFCPACGTSPRPGRAHNLPEPGVARRAVEDALRAWQRSPRVERTTTAIRPIMFVEQQQPAGQRLRGFEILGETPGYEDEGYRRILVRLALADPEESIVAAYYVFGQSPVWVYRAEDFDMIMHMDKSMMPPPPRTGAGEPGPVRGEDATSAGRAGGLRLVRAGPNVPADPEVWQSHSMGLLANLMSTPPARPTLCVVGGPLAGRRPGEVRAGDSPRMPRAEHP